MTGLVLLRRAGQRILIRHKSGDELWVILKQEGSKLRLVFDGPKTFEIQREEIVDRDER